MCTSFKIKATDNSVVIGRTMEFAIDLKSQLTILPRGYQYKGTAPNNQPGMTWQGKYGVVGMNSFGIDSLSDGINEAGLFFCVLYLPGFSKYQEIPAGQESKALSQLLDLSNYILSTCATIAEVKQALANVLVWGTDVPQAGGVIGLHYAVHDAGGNSIAVEYVNGELQIHDNPIGTLTNSPPFEWHMLNLGNFVNLSATNVPDLKTMNYDVKALGQGSGMLGLPGDFTPPSRFVRATALTQSAIPKQTAEESSVLAYHIISSFDIVKGLVRGNENGQEVLESTQWLSISDLKNRQYFVRYYDNPAVLRVELSAIDFAKPNITHIPMPAGLNWFTDVTSQQV